MNGFIWLIWAGAGLVVFLLMMQLVFGIVIINERQVGVVVKKWGGKSLLPGHLLALNGEAGYQADTLAPGWHIGYWPWQYTIRKGRSTGAAERDRARDGERRRAIPAGRILGRVVDCDNFQDGRRNFLANGGEKGRQLGILTAGTYRINTALFP